MPASPNVQTDLLSEFENMFHFMHSPSPCQYDIAFQIEYLHEKTTPQAFKRLAKARRVVLKGLFI
jgi:hypothetical protein